MAHQYHGTGAKRAGIVLCGGLSSRMGRAKALLPWFGDRVMIQHVTDTLRAVVDEVIVVRSEELVLPPLCEGVRIVVDQEAARGPLAGIRDGLSAMKAESAFVTSTDAPFLTEAYIEALFECAGDAACAPVEEGFVQVLSAIYPRAARAQAEALLDAGNGRPRALLESLSYRPFEAAMGDSGNEDGRQAWEGFNTPEAYLEIVRSVDPGASAIVRREGAGPPLESRVPVGTLAEVCAAGLRAFGSSGRSAGEAEEASPPLDGINAHLGNATADTSPLPGTVPIGPSERVTLRLAAERAHGESACIREMVR